ncbi:nucleotidyl transferase family protein [Treponema sp. R80B11-R83G3]
MMKIIEWQKFLEDGFSHNVKSSSMTVGIFDGVHIGHQALLKRIVSHDANKTPVVVTFRHNHKIESGNILTFDQRLDIFKSMGIKITVVIDFTEEFKKMKGIEFLNILLKRGNVGFFAVGSGFRCGYQQDTDAETIQKFFTSHNIQVEILPKVTEGALPVSSSRIRSAISAGDIEAAQKMLGRAYP